MSLQMEDKSSLKFSVITVCKNSSRTIEKCIQSVNKQNYQNIEHIIIDGVSTDDTLQIINEVKNSSTFVHVGADDGIYDAMNKGIAIASGDYIGILNSDDYYPRETIISEINSFCLTNNSQIISGNLSIVDNSENILRHIKSSRFKKWMLHYGWMLPHPATFISRSLFERIGDYNTNFVTAADYEFFIRALIKHKVNFVTIDSIFVNMLVGGATTSGLKSYWKTTKEIQIALKLHGIRARLLLLLFRLPMKFFSQRLRR